MYSKMCRKLIARQIQRLSGTAIRPVIGCVVAALAPSVLRAADVPLVADTYISGSIPALNFGGLANLNVGNTTTNNVALLKFDLSVLPTGGVAHATLRIFVNKVGTPGSIDVLTVTSPWTEGAITAQFPPTLGGIVATAVPVTTSGSYVAIDVTSIVQNEVSLASFYPNNGFAIVADASAPATAIFLDSKESTSTSHPPTLDVTMSGPAGPQGATGAQGPQGQQGPQGPAGLQGPTGTVGAPGAQGPAGLVWRGAWNPSPSVVYAAHDAVSFQGSSYVALLGGGGVQPDINPQAWSLLASIGLAGAAGTNGATGAAGAQGIQGPQGAPGIPGLPGAQGPAGPQGDAGAAGVPGVVWRGVWNPDPNFHYATGDAVSFSGSSYVALTANNGAQPNNPQYLGVLWGLLASAGSQGASGQQGAAGAPGLVWRGTYNPDPNVSYAANDVVSFGGSTYLSIRGGNGGQPDINTTSWSVLSSKGATGVAGPTGPQGTAGQQGSTGPAGPQGVQGATGAAGPSHAWSADTFASDNCNADGTGTCANNPLSLPAGSYVIHARASSFSSVIAGGSVSCYMRTSSSGYLTLPIEGVFNQLAAINSSIDYIFFDAVFGSNGWHPLVGTANLVQPDSVFVQCGTSVPAILSWRLIATQVGGLN